MDLLRGVIATSREMRKMIRRHSLEMKKENNNVREIEQYRVELPPLMLKKGATVAFWGNDFLINNIFPNYPPIELMKY